MTPVLPATSAKKRGKPPLKGSEKPSEYEPARTEERAREPRRESSPDSLPLFLQRGRDGTHEGATGAPATPLPNRIRAAASHGGERLPAYLQHEFGQRLGTDASRVRVHTGPEADGLSREVRARAFTTGSDIFFRSGEYRPNDRAGVELLAHEVVHTEQQRQGTISAQASGAGVALSQPSDRFEQEADRAAHSFVAGGSHSGGVTPTGSSASVQRKCACEGSGTSCAKCDEEKKLPVQRRAEGSGALAGSMEMSPGYHSQYSAGAGMFIQRQNIDHRDVDWSDFQKPVPKGARFDAETWSQIADPALAGAMPAINPVSTGTPCKVGKKDDTKYKVNIAIDPSKIVVKSFMATDKSFHQPWLTDETARRQECLNELTPQCERSFDNRFRIAKTVRAKAVRDCQKAFDEKHTSVTRGSASASTRAECSTTFAADVEQAEKDSAFWDSPRSSIHVTTRAGCRDASFLDPCAKDEMQVNSDRVLSHEQGHFDLTDDMAMKAQSELRAMVATFPTEVEACGEKAAKSLAQKTVAKELAKLNAKLAAVKKQMKTLQNQYDTQTAHGTREAAQDAWKKRIEKGFIPATP